MSRDGIIRLDQGSIGGVGGGTEGIRFLEDLGELFGASLGLGLTAQIYLTQKMKEDEVHNIALNE